MLRELQKLQQSIGELITEVQYRTPQKRNQDPLAVNPTGPWSSREVLIHIVNWHEAILNTIQTTLNRKKPILPEGTFEQINAKAVKQNARFPNQILIKRLRTTQKSIELLANRLTGYTTKFQFKEGGKSYTILEIVINLEKHIRNHIMKLKKAHDLK